MLRLFLRLYLFLMLPATAAFVLFMYVTDQVMAPIVAANPIHPATTRGRSSSNIPDITRQSIETSASA